MTLTNDIEECCVHLESNRITDRKKFCNKLTTLLDNKDVIYILNEGTSISWKQVISSLQECLRKDAEKFVEDAKKKGCEPVPSPASGLFMQVIEIATSQTDNEVDISELSGYIIGCMKDHKMKKCYVSILMNVLYKCILAKSKSRGKLDQNDWGGLYEFLKDLCSERSHDMLTYKCLNLLIKWGPLSGLQASVMREEFTFLTRFCQLISQNSPKPQQEDTLEIAIEFCRHTAKDNRVSCCKFGEDVLPSFIQLYELNGREAKIKELLVQFSLLQVIIHQPNGVKEGHQVAYAFSWQSWKKCLKMIYVLLSKEINFYFQFRQKNTSFFKSQGESMILTEEFTILFVEISRLLFSCTDMDYTMSLDTDSSQIPQKRQKIDISLRSYITNIQDLKSWLWIHIVNSIIIRYPDIIDDEDYLLLLQILSTIQIESNDHNVIENIYHCLTTMLSIHSRKMNNIVCPPETEILWKVVGESTIRAFALNQHKAVTEVLLEKLIRNGIVHIDNIFQAYTSGILNISPQSIKTLHSALDFANIDQNEHCRKENLMKCILNPQNLKDYKYLRESRTAEFLVKLTLKEWPKSTDTDNEESNEMWNEYKDLIEIYLKTMFEDNAVARRDKDNVNVETTENNHSMELESATLMTNILKNFVQNTSDTEEILLSFLILIVNIASYAIDYDFLSEIQINDSVFIDLINEIFGHEKIKHFDLYKTKNEREAKRLLDCVDILDTLFSLRINTWMMKKLKSLVPLEFLRSLNLIFNDLQEEQKRKCNLFFDIKKGILKVLSTFSCVHGDFLNENQKNILEVLSVPSYNFNIDEDCTLCLTFLRSLKLAKPGVLPDNVLDNVLKSIQELCAARYQYSSYAVEILKILKDLFPHFAASSDEDNKNTAVALLKPFYDNYRNYGPSVALNLLDCMKKLCQIDPQCKFSLWFDIEVVRYVPEFLSSDFQEVRFKAIDTLVVFFSTNSRIKHLRDFHRQEEIFAKIYEMSNKVFEVGAISTDERRTDEVICRTASVLHTFSGIIMNGNNWIEECLFGLMKISYEKGIDSIDRILKVISKHLLGDANSNIMEKYLERLIERWLREGLQFDNFQFKLLKCDTKEAFYLKYFELCVPYLIVSDKKDLLSAAKQLQWTETKVVEKTAAKIFSKAICNDIENMGEHLTERNKSLSYYSTIVGSSNLKQILTNNLETLILGVLEFLTDEIYIKNTFEEIVIFPSKNLSVAQLKTCLTFIESYLCNGQSLVKFLCETNLGKMEKILLAVKLDFHNAISTEEKLKALHRYTFFVTIVSEIMAKNSEWQYYFLRDTIHTLINIIATQKDSPCVARGACKFLNIFFRNILPSYPDTLGQFLTFIVNSLKVFAVSQSVISVDCMDVLNFLIVENASKLMSQIEKLDNFPNHQYFQKIRTVHSKIRYGQKDISLEDEINLFLKHTDISTQQDSLIHLRKILSERKNDLKELYDKLQNIRGFSEDCEESSLHRLICTLSKFSCSRNQNVSFEAIRCLGELGPANLQTLVLQPEKTISDLKCSAFELLSGHVISLLIEYLVDSNINVVKTASETFYTVLDCREARTIAESNTDFGNGPINKKYILPFYPPNKASSTSRVAVDQEKFNSNIPNDSLWCPKEKSNHENWIITLVSELLDTFTYQSYLQKLIPVCKVKSEFAEQLLPLVVNIFLSLNNSRITNILLKKIDYFFDQHWQYAVPKYVEQNSITLNKKSVRCMLEVVSFIRLQRSFSSSKSKPSGELNINYLKVAKSAEFCAAHFSALLYAELWCQLKIEDIQNQDVSYCEKRSTMLDFIYEHQGAEVGEALQNILRNAYKSIGDLDALPGCGISFLLEPHFRVEHYKELGKWDQVTQFYAMQLFHSQNSPANELMESFKKNSLYQIPLLCSNNLDLDSQYECMWRLGQWTSGEKRKNSPKTVLSQEDFEKYRYYSLKALHDNNQCAFDETKKNQSLCIIDHLKHTSLESSQSLYPVLMRLQSLVEMENFAETSTTQSITSILTKWKTHDNLIEKSDFQYVEPIITQRLVMLTDYLKKNHNDQLKDYICDLSLDFTNLAKEEGHFKEGLTILEKLKYMSDISENVRTKIQLLDAQLSWLVNNKLVARHILNRLCKNEQICPKLRSRALKLSGQYMSETHSENRTTIISKYFLKSIKLMSTTNRNEKDIEDIMDTYDKLALFADREYQMIMMYTKSELFQRKIVNMEKAKREASNIQKQRKRTHDELKAAAIHDKQSNIDEIEINNTKVEGNQFLKLAFKYYLLTLVHSEDRNIRIFRIMSLFLENRNNDQIADTVEEHLHKLPTYKYITMLPQLIPHITETNTDLFSRRVNEIVEKCAIDHPHHTLPLLLSLVNANKDKEYSGMKGSASNTSKNDSRVSTAKNLLAKLKKRESLCALIDRLQQVSIALIDLAYYSDKNSENERVAQFKIPRSQKIMSIQNFDDVLLPTYNLNVDPSNKYSRIVGISSFGSVYHPVGGVNKPKKITCRGTDGKVHSQLVKGQDDIRQDAVMQQVFNIMNNLLSINKQTKKLLIRTYKVVPLSMRSGILKWVDDSMPIGEYLVGGEKNKIGAHQMYRPNDKSPGSCRASFKNCAGQSAEAKLVTYNEICKNFKPVFHKFFQTSFPQPTIWYERRRAYIHSVATTSMCGYVLGIGDRHVSNILIDMTTAEVIHIDFGIAFEQGRVLPTPETVPFRLTRDVVDGMGASGVEGIFRRSCEKTMEVLRQNSQTIITILEVLLYDPLYAWTVTSAEANKRQTDDEIDLRNLSNNLSEEENVTVNVTAERALLRLREKLQGTELGHPTSIEHQVGTLIQQAIDPANLCKLFVGWQPYL
ncbi:unnamed protein product [Phaedon cochleariae]|uniref:non-specific serine/threonine protein kinase n=1 Tax=Phaedon cochleariae TaxID=80249 RepID=A0A9P0DSD5_PHACE|nr:unnamed protein product [Phaedon cochleariae]